MSTIIFPLYDNLLKDLEKEEISQKEQDKFMKLIKSFDVSGCEIIYILVLCYQIEHKDNSNTMILPYSGKFINNDIIFDFNEFPYDLKKMDVIYKQGFTRVYYDDQFYLIEDLKELNHSKELYLVVDRISTDF